jgi:secreted trypsin-like serine protease
MLDRSRVKQWIITGAQATALFAVIGTVVHVSAASAQNAHTGKAQQPPAVSERGLERAEVDLRQHIRVIGGEPAKVGDWPWQVALKRRSADGKFNFICGGSVIAEHWVLTAGHCVTDGDGKAQSPDSFLLIGGTHDIKSDSSGERLHVKRVLPHEGYSSKTLENDIALLEVVESARSAPVPFADAKNAALEAPGKDATVTGWGLIRAIHYEANPSGGMMALDAETKAQISPSEMESKYLTNQLQQLTMPLVALDQCSAMYKPKNYGVTIDNRVVCAGLPGAQKKDACHGDSGGPLVVKDDTGYVQVGVVSLGDPDCVVEGLPGIYTRVSAFEPWLRKMTGINQEAPPTAVETQTVADNSLTGDNPAGLEVSFVQGGAVKVGQRVQFRVTANQPGFLVLFDAGPDGKITQIYPNSFSLRGPLGSRVASNRLEAPRPLVVPDAANPYSAFEFRIDPPAGEGKILAVLSDEPIQELQIAGDQKAGDAQRQLKSFDSRAKVISLLGMLSSKVKRDLATSSGSTPHFSVAITGYQVEP